MDEQKIAKGIVQILDGIGENRNRPGLRETPRRVAEMFMELLSGTNKQPVLNVGFTEDISDKEIILIKDIHFYSFCEHHLLPFFGKVNIGYQPANNRVAGFSNFIGIVDTYSKRLQIQERLTNQIADAIMKSLQPTGVVVLIEATQLCVSMRKTHTPGTKTVTRVIRGKLSSEQISRVFS
jgi:GTP cyclohydrolase I